MAKDYKSPIGQVLRKGTEVRFPLTFDRGINISGKDASNGEEPEIYVFRFDGEIHNLREIHVKHDDPALKDLIIQKQPLKVGDVVRWYPEGGNEVYGIRPQHYISGCKVLGRFFDPDEPKESQDQWIIRFTFGEITHKEIVPESELIHEDHGLPSGPNKDAQK